MAVLHKNESDYMEFSGKNTFNGNYAPLYYGDFVLACQATFLISINAFTFLFFLLLFSMYHYFMMIFFKTFFLGP